MIRLLIPLIALGLFIWLAVYAWHNHPPVHRSSYNQFVDQQLAAYHPKDAGVTFRGHEHTKLVWSNKKAALLAEALSLTPEAIDTTVDVRREP